MDNYQPDLNSVFHALSDSTRRAVIQQLGQGHATVSELAEPFDMALPSFMKHLRVLETADLISSEKIGRVRICKIRKQTITTIDTWISEQRDLWEGRADRLANYAEQLSIEDKTL